MNRPSLAQRTISVGNAVLGCTLSIFIAFGGALLAAYLRASVWWLLPVAACFAFWSARVSTAFSMLGASGESHRSCAMFLVAVIPTGFAFLLQCAIYWLARYFVF